MTLNNHVTLRSLSRWGVNAQPCSYQRQNFYVKLSLCSQSHLYILTIETFPRFYYGQFAREPKNTFCVNILCSLNQVFCLWNYITTSLKREALKSDWRNRNCIHHLFGLILKQAMFGKKLIMRLVQNEIKRCDKQIAVSQAFWTEN